MSKEDELWSLGKLQLAVYQIIKSEPLLSPANISLRVGARWWGVGNTLSSLVRKGFIKRVRRGRYEAIL